MPRRADIAIASDFNVANWQGGATNHIVQAANGSYYQFYIDATLDVVYCKSTDGLQWGPSILAATAGSTTQLAVWYDRWTDPSGTLGDRIHFAFTDSGNDDTFYRTLNTADDSLSTQTTIFAGASTVNPNGHLSITRAVGGNVYCKMVIDSGAEGGFFRLPTANVPNGAWDAARTIDEVLAGSDIIILQPDFLAADTQDIMAFFWDASANEISRKLYDDSANTWAETSIAGSMVEPGSNVCYPPFDAFPDVDNDRSFLFAWTQVDLLNADLRCWIVDRNTITEVTNVVANSVDDQGLIAAGLDTDTGDVHAFYAGKSDGSETWITALKVYTKVSQDDGSTWGPETLVTQGAAASIRSLFTIPRFTGDPKVAWIRDATQSDDLLVSALIAQPRADYALGV